MLKIDFFLTQWSSLANLDSFFLPHKKKYLFDLLETFIALKSEDKTLESINPLAIKGPTASGKTHILEGVARLIHEKKPELKIAFGKAIGLVSIFNDKRGQARRIQELQNCDVLLLDDIQALAPYPLVQDDLASLIDVLQNKNTFIVTTYSAFGEYENFNSSSQMRGIEENLLSRIFSGISYQIDKPDLDIRMRIVNEEAQIIGLELSKSMSLNIARSSQDVRQVKGIVKTLRAYTQAGNKILTEEDLERFVDSYDSKNVVTPELILVQTAVFFNVQLSDLKGKKRTKDILLARQMSMYLCRKMLALPFSAIAELFGGKDHTTVIHAYKKIEKEQDLRITLDVLSQRIAHSASFMHGSYN